MVISGPLSIAAAVADEVRLTAGADGPTLGNQTLLFGQTLTVTASSYNQSLFIGTKSVSWAWNGGGNLSVVTGPMTSLTPDSLDCLCFLTATESQSVITVILGVEVLAPIIDQVMLTFTNGTPLPDPLVLDIDTTISILARGINTTLDAAIGNVTGTWELSGDQNLSGASLRDDQEGIGFVAGLAPGNHTLTFDAAGWNLSIAIDVNDLIIDAVRITSAANLSSTPVGSVVVDVTATFVLYAVGVNTTTGQGLAFITGNWSLAPALADLSSADGSSVTVTAGTAGGTADLVFTTVGDLSVTVVIAVRAPTVSGIALVGASDASTPVTHLNVTMRSEVRLWVIAWNDSIGGLAAPNATWTIDGAAFLEVTQGTDQGSENLLTFGSVARTFYWRVDLAGITFRVNISIIDDEPPVLLYLLANNERDLLLGYAAGGFQISTEVSDAGHGFSTIIAAEYAIDDREGAWLPMDATDGNLSAYREGMRIIIDVRNWSIDEQHIVYVRGSDGHAWSEIGWVNVTIVDDDPPVVLGLTGGGESTPIWGIAAGPLPLEFIASDLHHGRSLVTGAEYFLTGDPLPGDGTLIPLTDPAVEVDLAAMIDLSGFVAGEEVEVWVRVRDPYGWGDPAVLRVTIRDDLGPIIRAIGFTPARLTLGLSALPVSLVFEVDDRNRGESVAAAAEYTLDASSPAGTGLPLHGRQDVPRAAYEEYLLPVDGERFPGTGTWDLWLRGSDGTEWGPNLRLTLVIYADSQSLTLDGKGSGVLLDPSLGSHAVRATVHCGGVVMDEVVLLRDGSPVAGVTISAESGGIGGTSTTINARLTNAQLGNQSGTLGVHGTGTGGEICPVILLDYGLDLLPVGGDGGDDDMGGLLAVIVIFGLLILGAAAVAYGIMRNRDPVGRPDPAGSAGSEDAQQDEDGGDHRQDPDADQEPSEADPPGHAQEQVDGEQTDHQGHQQGDQ